MRFEADVEIGIEDDIEMILRWRLDKSGLMSGILQR